MKARYQKMEEIIEDGKEQGFIEANPANDIEGHDAAAKVAVLANVFMGADMTPLDVECEGIQNITELDIKNAAEKNAVIKLMCRIEKDENGKIRGKVAPEEVDKKDIYASIEGTSSILTIQTDLMGTLTVIEEAPEVQQSAYGIFADLMAIIEKD